MPDDAVVRSARSQAAGSTKDWSSFDQTLDEVRRGFDDLPVEEVEALVDEALAHVRRTKNARTR